MKIISNFIFIFVLFFSELVFSAQEPARELNDESKVQQSPAASINAVNGVVNGIGGCPGIYPSCNTCGPNSCGQNCCARESEPGFELNYPDNCSNWIRPNLVPMPPGLICHLDIDTHLFDVDIEIYAVDLLQDTSCAQQPSRYNKVRKATVSCSHFTSIFNQDACARRIQAKVTEVANSGYVPIFLDADRDYCPRGTAACSSDSQCNNGIFCDGVESCVAGQCTAGVRACSAPGLTCLESQARCVGTGSSCSTDTECNNGLFCDGVERCVSGSCQSGVRPCDAIGLCSESQDRCIIDQGCGTRGRICP